MGKCLGSILTVVLVGCASESPRPAPPPAARPSVPIQREATSTPPKKALPDGVTVLAFVGPAWTTEQTPVAMCVDAINSKSLIVVRADPRKVGLTLINKSERGFDTDIETTAQAEHLLVATNAGMYATGRVISLYAPEVGYQSRIGASPVGMTTSSGAIGPVGNPFLHGGDAFIFPVPAQAF